MHKCVHSFIMFNVPALRKKQSHLISCSKAIIFIAGDFISIVDHSISQWSMFLCQSQILHHEVYMYDYFFKPLGGHIILSCQQRAHRQSPTGNLTSTLLCFMLDPKKQDTTLSNKMPTNIYTIHTHKWSTDIINLHKESHCT